MCVWIGEDVAQCNFAYNSTVSRSPLSGSSSGNPNSLGYLSCRALSYGRGAGSAAKLSKLRLDLILGSDMMLGVDLMSMISMPFSPSNAWVSCIIELPSPHRGPTELPSSMGTMSVEVVLLILREVAAISPSRRRLLVFLTARPSTANTRSERKAKPIIANPPKSEGEFRPSVLVVYSSPLLIEAILLLGPVPSETLAIALPLVLLEGSSEELAVGAKLALLSSEKDGEGVGPIPDVDDVSSPESSVVRIVGDSVTDSVVVGTAVGALVVGDDATEDEVVGLDVGVVVGVRVSDAVGGNAVLLVALSDVGLAAGVSPASVG
mmetsp:Transcript_8340/g.18768  ORF Transcript_8340/g.18768 Transcript_8340/m.18768 type:complete len:321 (-) Transcript_8340:625-1587(-)